MKYLFRISALMFLSVTLAFLSFPAHPTNPSLSNRHQERKDSLVINGNLYKPEGNGQFPAVVVLHGCGWN
jgi:poly(3-hydroxybutyrate) depolymerase